MEVPGEQETLAPLGQRRGQHQTIDPTALGRGDHLMPRTGLEPDLDAELVAEQPQMVHGKAGDTPLPDRMTTFSALQQRNSIAVGRMPTARSSWASMGRRGALGLRTGGDAEFLT